MKAPTHLFAAALLATMATYAAAQNVNRAEEGRAAAAQCYGTCVDRAQTTSLALYRRADRLTDLVISDEYFELNDESQDNLVRLEEDAICALAQDHVRALDACNATCTDVERAYGSPSSLARSRFREIFYAERDALRAVGLWGTSYRDLPTAGAAFTNACGRFWETGGSGANAQLSRLADLPRRVGHRAKPPTRAVDGKADTETQ